MFIGQEEYKITLVDRVSAEIQLESVDETSPVFPPPPGDGWHLHNISVGQFKYIVSWKRHIVEPAVENPASYDAFGRARTSEPHTLFDSQLQYDKAPQLWSESVTGSGASSSHLANEACVLMRVGTAAGEKVVRQGRVYTRYQPGMSHLVLMTGILGPRKTGVRQRIGYFDEQNGVFFEVNNGNLRIVKRSYTTGTAVDHVVEQANWNLDKMDGTGKSGLTIDTTKTQIFVMDFQWLGVGRIRTGLVINGNLIYVHEFVHANILTSVYITSVNLAPRYEIENIATSASQTDMKQICAAVMSEGGYNPRGFLRTEAITTPKQISTSLVPILSVRPKAAYKGTWFEPLNYSFINTAASYVYFQIILSPTLVGASWRDSMSTPYAEADTNATALSGGIVLSSGFVNNKSDYSSNIGNNIPIMGTNLDGSRDYITIAMQSVSNNANVLASINWKEVR